MWQHISEFLIECFFARDFHTFVSMLVSHVFFETIVPSVSEWTSVLGAIEWLQTRMDHVVFSEWLSREEWPSALITLKIIKENHFLDILYQHRLVQKNALISPTRFDFCFSWIFRMCLTILLAVRNLIGQNWHGYGCTPLWVRSWIFKLAFVFVLNEQDEHLKSFVSVWVIRWILTALDVLNDFPQTCSVDNFYLINL